MPDVPHDMGIDVGVASLGVALIKLDRNGEPARLLDGVSHAYRAPTAGAERRGIKAARDGYQRRNKRLKYLREKLATLLDLPRGFDQLPVGQTTPEQGTSRVRLRAGAIGEPLSADDLARAILHLARNRGLRLTRVPGDSEDALAKDERRKVKQSAQLALRMRQDLKGQTLGQFLYARELAGKTTRRRKGWPVDFIVTRQMVEAEFDAIIQAQAAYHPQLTPDVVADLRALVFWEKQPPEPEVGICCYGVRGPDGVYERRLPIASDLFQAKRIYEEVNNIRIVAQDQSKRPLTLQQRDAVVARLMAGEDLKATGIKAIVGPLARREKVSLEAGYGKKKSAVSRALKGHAVARAFKGGPIEHVFAALPADERGTLIEELRTIGEIDVLAGRLGEVFAIDESATLELASDLALPQGYAKAGPTATARLLEHLKADVTDTRTAEERAGLAHLSGKDMRGDRLPYYGLVFPHLVRGATEDPADKLEVQYGRIPNPVVHAAFNRLRKVINLYLKEYGPPRRIVIELARDMNKSQEERDALSRNNAKAHNENEDRIDPLIRAQGKNPTRHNRRKVRLAEQQDWCCPYTGKPICAETLFDGSFDIDHILPRAATLDDSMGNLVVSCEQANKVKADRAPYAAFHGGYRGRAYEQIIEKITKHTPWKAWRFAPDAMDRFDDQDAFRERFMTDTRYIAKWAAQYLTCVCDDVIVVNGRIVSELRYLWGLHNVVAELQSEEDALTADTAGPDDRRPAQNRKRGKKSRSDHRHNLLDAIVAGLVDRSMVQLLQTAAGKGRKDQETAERLRRNQPLGPGLRAMVKGFLADKRTTHRRNHAPDGRLHRPNAHSVLARLPDGKYVARRRVALTTDNFKKRSDLDKIGVPSHILSKISAAEETYWGGEAPGDALLRVAKELGDTRDRLVRFYNAAPTTKMVPVRGKRDAREPAEEEKKTTELDRMAHALQALIDDTGRRHVHAFEVASLRILRGPIAPDKRPRLAYEGHGNNRLEYFLDSTGEPGWEVISTLDDNTRGFRPDWRVQAGARLIFDLRKNDLVTMLIDPATGDGRRLYRIKSLSPGDIEFMPVNDARDKASPGWVRLKSLKAFVDRRPVKVLRDDIGRETWRSSPRNW